MDVVFGTHQAPGMMFFFVPSKFLLRKITSWHHSNHTVLLGQKPVIFPSSIYLWRQRQGYWTHSSVISAPARYTIFPSRCLAQAMITLMKTWILFFPIAAFDKIFMKKQKYKSRRRWALYSLKSGFQCSWLLKVLTKDLSFSLVSWLRKYTYFNYTYSKSFLIYRIKCLAGCVRWMLVTRYTNRLGHLYNSGSFADYSRNVGVVRGCSNRKI